MPRLFVSSAGLLRWVVALLALSCASCGATGDVSHPQPDFPLVEPETVELAYDEEDRANARALDLEAVAEGPLQVAEQGLVGDAARTLRPMREALLGSNNLLRTGLLQLRRVTEEGTFVGGDAELGRWELEGERNLLQLTIERSSPGSARWSYLLRASPLGSDALGRIVLEGWFEHEGRDAAGRQLGSGFFRYNYSALGSGPNAESGRGAVGFLVTPRGRAYSMFLLDFVPRGAADRTPLNGRFSFAEVSGEGGLFRFIVRGDLLEQEPGREQLSQAVRWDASGAARSHASVVLSRGGVGATIEECWGPDRAQVWVQSRPEQPEFIADGRERDCAFFDRPELPDPRPVGEVDDPSVPVAP